MRMETKIGDYDHIVDVYFDYEPPEYGDSECAPISAYVELEEVFLTGIDIIDIISDDIKEKIRDEILRLADGGKEDVFCNM
jgi:hypothetical protein